MCITAKIRFSLVDPLGFSHCLQAMFCTRFPPTISSTVCLCLSPPLVPSLLCACESSSFLTLSICFCLHLHSCIPSLPLSTKSPGHQSYVVFGSTEVHSLLHLAQLPLADPQAPGGDSAAAHAGPLPLLNPWLLGQEDSGGLTCW